MSKFLSSLIAGAASGAAVAYFLSTEKGKEVKASVTRAYDAYRENPSDYHQLIKDKATDYSQLAVDTFNEYKEKFETGELTSDDVIETAKAKGAEVADYATNIFSQAKDKMQSSETIVTAETPSEDIVIDLADIKMDEVEDDRNED